MTPQTHHQFSLWLPAHTPRNRKIAVGVAVAVALLAVYMIRDALTRGDTTDAVATLLVCGVVFWLATLFAIDRALCVNVIDYFLVTEAYLERQRRLAAKQKELTGVAVEIQRETDKLKPPPDPIQQAWQRGDRGGTVPAAKRVELEAMDRAFERETAGMPTDSPNYKLAWNDLQRRKREVMER